MEDLKNENGFNGSRSGDNHGLEQRGKDSRHRGSGSVSVRSRDPVQQVARQGIDYQPDILRITRELQEENAGRGSFTLRYWPEWVLAFFMVILTVVVLLTLLTLGGAEIIL